MAKVQEQGCGGLRRLVILLSTRLGRVPLALLLAFFFFPPALPNDEHGQLEKKNANGFAITTFSSC